MTRERHSDATCERRHRLWAYAQPPMSCAVGCACACHADKETTVNPVIIEEQVPSPDLLWQCLKHFAHLDHSNAVVHMSPVRYSPITFRLAEALHVGRPWTYDYRSPLDVHLIEAVLHDRGHYPEDRGRIEEDIDAD